MTGSSSTLGVIFKPFRVTLAAGNFKLVLDKKEDTLWLAPEKAGQQVEVPAYAELFGFGSGEYALSADSRQNKGQPFYFLTFYPIIRLLGGFS